ncbi:hypothetical protein MPTK1_2g10170 [Marchantia polymorpha subsp. ruderalis]|uniref:Uncharacterized protein n=1 Tax=Marchantia polymorpha TaxID=3197 RepID=A0A2R6W8G9_MARPO|nr:hypothetical protein MARPO_0129s0041 [Marchantia polymorpha]BBN01771.1 hypothetical protein Mp_2g10170 [Marchantia polymorpha subsp. ruderalis]|eukprot:PTQ30154.1 hypothetical protein MARPO_0129s0041 [Marchantia polymorpha]
MRFDSSEDRISATQTNGGAMSQNCIPRALFHTCRDKKAFSDYASMAFCKRIDFQLTNRTILKFVIIIAQEMHDCMYLR